MEDIFMKLLNMSITASWLILAVLCLRLLFRKAPKWIHCLLWGVVAFRLVCPVSIVSQYSVLPSTEPIKSCTITEGRVQDYVPSVDSDLTIVESKINPMLAETFAYNGWESVAPFQLFIYGVSIIWCIGIVLLMVYALLSTYKIRCSLREAICYRNNIFICDTVKSPFIMGIMNPKIYLSSSVKAEDMDYIVAHELAHLKRKDHWWKLLGYLLLCVYWFHPLVWIAYILFCKDIELACDEKVIKTMSFEEKKQYSHVLVSCSQPKNFVMVYPLAFGEVGVKERVESILNYKKPALGFIVATFGMCLIITACFLTNPIKKYEKTPLEKIEGCFDTGTECTLVDYYKMSDGTWKSGKYNYKYKLEVYGEKKSSKNVVTGTTYIILSNKKEITFEQAWLASGFGSNMTDGIHPKNAVIVGMILHN